MDLISEIVGRRLSAVERIIGPVERREFIFDARGSKWEKAYFLEESIAIIFIGGVADWIKITNQNASLIKGFIQTLELNLNKPPYIYNQQEVHYYNIHGIKEIAFFKDADDKISYVLIKAFTDWA